MNNIKNLASYSILLLSISGVQIALFPGPTVRTLIEFITYILISIIFISYSPFFRTRKLPYNNLIKLFVVYGLFVAIHSAVISESYEQWRYLVTVYAPFLLVPGMLYIASVPALTKEIFKVLLNITIPLSFVFFVMGRMKTDENISYVKYMSFIYVLILLIPYLKNKWKIIIILLSFISLFSNLDTRTNILCIAISFTLSILFYFYDNRKFKLGLRVFLLILPIIFLALGSFGVLNFFSYISSNEEYTINTGKSEVNLTTDSRTTIYNDAFGNLSNKNSWIFGVGATDIYKTGLNEELDGYSKGRMGGSESAFLNFISFGGIVYVTIVFLLFYLISYIAISKSNNTIVQILGVYLSFQWVFLFIENPIDINFYWVSSFIVMGICLSPEFRSMNNKQVLAYLKYI